MLTPFMNMREDEIDEDDMVDQLAGWLGDDDYGDDDVVGQLMSVGGKLINIHTRSDLMSGNYIQLFRQPIRIIICH